MSQAARSGDLERIVAFVEQDADVVHAHRWEFTLLRIAAYWGHVDMGRYLLDHGAAVNYRGCDGVTALHAACCKITSDAAVVSLLLERGADVTAVDAYSGTPLLGAAGRADDSVTRVLLEHGGGDLDAVDHSPYDSDDPDSPEKRWTVCHHACEYLQLGGLMRLLEAGADPTVRDGCGYTPADYAATDGPGRLVDPQYRYGSVFARRRQCLRMLRGRHRVYTLHRARSIREASLIVADSSAPVDAAPPYLMDRVTSCLPMPAVHISAQQQFAQPPHLLGGEEGVQLDPSNAAGYGDVELHPHSVKGERHVELDNGDARGEQFSDVDHDSVGWGGHVGLDTGDGDEEGHVEVDYGDVGWEEYSEVDPDVEGGEGHVELDTDGVEGEGHVELDTVDEQHSDFDPDAVEGEVNESVIVQAEYAEYDPGPVGGVVIEHVVAELNGQGFVELMELVGMIRL